MQAFRAHIAVTNVPLDDDLADSLLDALERLHGDMGPVVSGERGAADLTITLAVDATDQAQAAAVTVAAVSDGLRAAELGDLYASAIELEPVTTSRN